MSNFPHSLATAAGSRGLRGSTRHLTPLARLLRKVRPCRRSVWREVRGGRSLKCSAMSSADLAVADRAIHAATVWDRGEVTAYGAPSRLVRRNPTPLQAR